MLDATFWVAISFLLFIALLLYKKIPKIVLDQLDNKIAELKGKIDEAEILKSNSEKLLSDAQSKLEKSDDENIQFVKNESAENRKSILQSYDQLLNEKYEVKLNQKTIDRVKNYFK